MIIDFHTHIFPDVIAQRAYDSLTKNANGEYFPRYDLTAKGLLDSMKKYGIDLAGHRARPFSPYMISEYDLFCVMTESHAQALSQVVSRDKIHVLGGGISDPYGKGEKAYEILQQSCSCSVLNTLCYLMLVTFLWI